MENYPAGVSSSHPHFNPPAEQECANCKADVHPGEDCSECGAYCFTEAEMRESWEADQADRAYDMRFDR